MSNQNNVPPKTIHVKEKDSRDIEPEVAEVSDDFDGVSEEITIATRDKAAGIVGKKGRPSGWDTAIKRADKPVIKCDIGASCAFNSKNGFGKIRVHLAWDQPKPSSFTEKLKNLVGRPQSIDLDLGCLYELKDGTRGVVQAFGKSFGAIDKPPFIHLQGDDKTGASAGENMIINGLRWEDIRRILIYTYIYDGVCSWSRTNAVVTISVPSQNPLEVRLAEYCDGLPVCAVAKMTNEGGAIGITNLNEYYPGHPEMERAFGFGINWEEGEKDK